VASAPKRALKLAGKAAAWFGAMLGLFMLAAWVGSAIPRNSAWIEPESGVPILVETNGVHTAIVMPLVTARKDWRAAFPAQDLGAPDRPYTHVSVSWGEREVFLDTPTWGELSPLTAIRAATGGDGLLHVAHYVRPAPDSNARQIVLRPAEYARLVTAIDSNILPHAEVYLGYEDWDVFYEATGRYHFANTCNQWVSDVLASAGVRVGLWTPFAGGVMKWFPASGQEPAAAKAFR
jgi:uncharacterized protein (TIGR02117 family)